MLTKTFLVSFVLISAFVASPFLYSQDDRENGSRELGSVAIPDVKSDFIPNALTIDTINQRAEAAKEVTGTDDATQSTIQQLYERSRQQLEAAKKSASELAQFQKTAQQADSLLETAKSELKRLNDESGTSAGKLKIPDDATETQLQELARKYNADLTAAREAAVQVAGEPARRQTRLLEMPDLSKATRKRLDEIESQLKADVPAGEAAVVTQARMTQLTAEYQNLKTQLAALDAELLAYNQTTELPVLQEQIAQQLVQQLEAHVAKLKTTIAKKRESEIQKRIREAKEDLERAAPLVKPVAQINLDLVKQLEDVSKNISRVSKNELRIESSRVQLEQKYATTQNRVKAIGLNDTLGVMLRQNKSELKKLRQRFPVNNNLQEELETIQAETFHAEDRVKELEKIAPALDQLATDLEIPTGKTAEFKLAVEPLLEKRKDCLTRLAELQNASFNAQLGQLTEQKELTKLCNEYENYIDEHVLWIRSAKVLGQAHLSGAFEASQQLVDPANWQSVGKSLLASINNRLPMFLIAACGLLVLFVFQPKLRKNITTTSKVASRRNCREFSPTAATLLETFLISSLWPLLLLIVGWLLKSDIRDMPFAHALGSGLIATGLALAPLEFLRQLCREDGLAESHFDWPDSARLTIRKNLRWLLVLGGPLMLIAVSFDNLNNEPWNNSLGRMAAISLLLMSTVFVYQVLRPGGPLFLNQQNRESSFYRLRYFRYAVFVLGHIALIGFAIAGYYYTTYQLGINFIHTVCLAIVGLTIYAMSLRFLLVRRRRLRYEQLIQTRELQQKKALAAAEAGTETTGSLTTANIAGALDIELQPEVGPDINSVSRQARELTGVIFAVAAIVFCYQIWADVLPATKLLDDINLWQVAIGDKGETQWVTLRDLLVSAGLFLLTFFSVRNIPGMLELLLLKQLPLDSGSRYAITTIFRYVITVVGVILALNFLKIPWSNYSWLVAAISVGLGFGLQEIVANFVSGLIILMERPVRVGDVVTIDGTTGVVSRIKMRATTITNWDNQELVVPNKDLVTGKLMNWTLSSVVNRVAVKVGVAYGTDIDKVHQLISQVAKDNPHVLDEPAPLVSFDEFGDSSLNFTLRCCITAIEKRFAIIHELNKAINDVLNRESISIPFPQRDVHMIAPPNSKPES